MNLNFVIIYVQDIEKAKAFYTDVLGLTVWEEQSAPTFVSLRGEGEAVLALQDKAGSKLPPKDEKSAGSVEISFAVDDVDATWRRWKDAGVDMICDPMDLPFGRYFMAKDPEGYYLSVYRFGQKSS